MSVQEVNQSACPYCAEPIAVTAKKCRHCGEILDAQMRDIEALKNRQSSPQVFMNAGGGGAAAASSAGGGFQLHAFRHWLHILLTFITGGLWLPVYILLYIFRNRNYYR